MTKFVYLAGPILGCTEGEAKDWRSLVNSRLKKRSIQEASVDIIAVSPLRCEPIIGERYDPQYADPQFGTARAIGSKNLFDVRSCDLVFAYLPVPPANRHQSYGTLIELGWAYVLGKPVVLVSDDPTVVQHPVVNSCAHWVLPTLQQGIEVVVGILGAYTGGKNV